MARDMGEPKINVFHPNNTPEQDAAVHKEINYVLSLMWMQYLRAGGDPDVFKNGKDVPPEEWDAYLESKKVSNIKKQQQKKQEQEKG